MSNLAPKGRYFDLCNKPGLFGFGWEAFLGNRECGYSPFWVSDQSVMDQFAHDPWGHDPSFMHNTPKLWESHDETDH